MKLQLKYKPLPENASKFAEDIVEAAREISGAELDYTVDSLETVEQIIQAMQDDGLTIDDIGETLFGFGCYVGEVFVRNGTGTWKVTGPTDQELIVFPLHIEVSPQSACDPIARVFRRLEEGESENIPYFYSVFAGPAVE